MINLKLSDAAVGSIRPPTRWNSKTGKNEPVDPYATFVERLHERTETQEPQPSLLWYSSIPDNAALYHRNYMEYLEHCWGSHLGITIWPDILWFTLLNELASFVRAHPEEHRSLFASAPEKKLLTVQSVGAVAVDMPLGELTALLRENVPTDTAVFLPEFSTTTDRSRHAMRAAFADMCTPYYDYMMYACNFPAIQILGTRQDWLALLNNWHKIAVSFRIAAPAVFPAAWMSKVGEILTRCLSQIDDAAWWREIFKLERCGSGGDTVASGWYADLFREQPRLAKVKNFGSCVAAVPYKHAALNKHFKLRDGLFYSVREDDFMIPDFGYAVLAADP